MKNNYLLRTVIGGLGLTMLSSGVFSQKDTSKISELFSMPLGELMNQEVITAAKFIQRSAESASSISVITAEEIESFNFSTLGDVLNSQRGMYLSNDRNYLYTGSRGFSRPTDYNNRIVIMIDGHIMNEVVYGSAFMGNELGLNLEAVERIEIIRGPGASLYGSGAMLNIVNIIMKKGRSLNGASISYTAGSLGLSEVSALAGAKLGKADLFLTGRAGSSEGEDFYFSELDDPLTNNGISSGMDWERYAGIHGGMTVGKLKFSGGYSSRSKGIPTGSFETDLTGDVNSADDRYYLEANFSNDTRENQRLNFRVYYDDYCYRGSYPSQGISLYDASDGRWAGAELQYFLGTGQKNSLVTGLEYKYIFKADYREWDASEVFFNENFPFYYLSVFAHDQYEISAKMSLTTGFRFDNYTVFGSSFSPRAALVYNLAEASSLKLIFGDAFRIPNIYESFYESENSHKSNPGIKPEKIQSLEFVWLQELDANLYFSFSAYSYLMKNLIDQHLDEADGLTHFMNLNKVRGNGLEAELRYRESGKYTGYLNLSLQNTTDIDNNSRLTNSPAFSSNAGVSLPFIKWFYLSPELYFETGRKTLADNMTDNLFLCNFSLRSGKFLKYMSLVARVNNIFNTSYSLPGGFEHAMDVIPQHGRTYSVKLNVKF
jgi:iron complex outermembrane receptor protein